MQTCERSHITQSRKRDEGDDGPEARREGDCMRSDALICKRAHTHTGTHASTTLTSYCRVNDVMPKLVSLDDATPNG